MTRRLWPPVVLLVLGSVLTSPALRAQDPATKTAQAAVQAWLLLIDSESYAASWDAAATFFRNAVTQDRWQAAVQMARAPLGRMKSRTLKSATPAKTLPGAPDGEYVVFQFNSSFDMTEAATELVTAMREEDGTWRVVGYFIK